jgi:hypothetical protein
MAHDAALSTESASAPFNQVILFMNSLLGQGWYPSPHASSRDAAGGQPRPAYAGGRRSVAKFDDDGMHATIRPFDE